jgi:hypothetical protein
MKSRENDYDACTLQIKIDGIPIPHQDFLLNSKIKQE